MLKKKSLGQNFLHNLHYVRLMADTAKVEKGDTVLEVGPGEGALTAQLLASRCQVIAVEKDHRLIPLLQEKFKEEIKRGQLELVEADILTFEPSDYKLKANNYKLVANIPYYISGAIFKKFLSEVAKQPSSMTLLVQKEVAERIARSKKESILSLSVKAYGNPKYIKTVPRGAFNPAPNVDSAILHITNISRDNFNTSAVEKKFFELVKTGFAQKRKLLGRNLEPLLGKNYTDALSKAGIEEKARAEDVDLTKWLKLAHVAAHK